MYLVTRRFFDLLDGGHVYSAGDVFPHDGREIDEARIAELSSWANKMGVPLIEEIVEKPKKTRKKTED